MGVLAQLQVWALTVLTLLESMLTARCEGGGVLTSYHMGQDDIYKDILKS